MNPIDSTVESIEAGSYNGVNSASVPPFHLWLKVQDVTFPITFDLFCTDADRTLATAAAR